MKRTWLISLLCTIWLAALGAGYLCLIVYKGQPGAAASDVSAWPEASSMQRDSKKLTLLMFAHPRCPCTRASLDELAVVLASSNKVMEARVFFYQPKFSDDDWRDSDTWQKALTMKGVHAIADPDGGEAKRFGATTSGQTFLFASNGRLLFRGGITGARGHVGPNAGRDAVLASTSGDGTSDCSPVFGCKLAD
jgi:hypothetical protein